MREPHVPVIPAVPFSEHFTGSDGATSGADKHGASSESRPAENSADAVHSNPDVKSVSNDSTTNSLSKKEDSPDVIDSISVESKENAANPDSVLANQKKATSNSKAET